MKSALQLRARTLLPIHSAGYQDFIRENFPDEWAARGDREPTDAEISRAQEAAKPLLASCASVRMVSYNHRPVVIRRDGTTVPARSDYRAPMPPMTQEARLECARNNDGFALTADSAGGEHQFEVLSPGTCGVAPLTAELTPAEPTGDLKTPTAVGATPNSLFSAEPSQQKPAQVASRVPVFGGPGGALSAVITADGVEKAQLAQNFATITGQQPLVGWGGETFAIKASNGQTVFYKTVKNGDFVYPPGTRRITLEMQAKEAFAAKAKAEKEAWDAMPAAQKMSVMLKRSVLGEPEEKDTSFFTSKKYWGDQFAEPKQPNVHLEAAKSTFAQAKQGLMNQSSAISANLARSASDLATNATDVKKSMVASAKAAMENARDIAGDIAGGTYAQASDALGRTLAAANYFRYRVFRR